MTETRKRAAQAQRDLARPPAHIPTFPPGRGSDDALLAVTFGPFLPQNRCTALIRANRTRSFEAEAQKASLGFVLGLVFKLVNYHG